MTNLKDYDSFAAFWQAVLKTGHGVIPAGEYDEVWEMTSPPGKQTIPVAITAYGAINRKTVSIARSRITLKGLTVQGAEIGFVITRGQGLVMESCTAKDCDTGFLFGIWGDAANCQVTYSLFQALVALGCRIGYEFNTDATVNRSWCNANTFVALTGRECNIGLYSISDLFNYNTFVGNAFELCETYDIYMPNARANTFSGGHIVGDSLLGPFSHILGGRYVLGVKQREEQPIQVLCNTAVRGLGGIIARLKLNK